MASPYSDLNPAIEEQRFLDVCRKAGEIINLGLLVYSPITHCHPIAKIYDLPKDYKYWKKVNHEFIMWADEVWILMLPGWDYSAGIKDELRFADSFLKPVRFLTDREVK